LVQKGYSKAKREEDSRTMIERKDCSVENIHGTITRTKENVENEIHNNGNIQ
jgi:hypothetical protein